MAGRVNIEELRKEEEIKNKKYVWKKPLIIAGRVIESIRESKERKEECYG
jgi:hypothetical protein